MIIQVHVIYKTVSPR